MKLKPNEYWAIWDMNSADFPYELRNVNCENLRKTKIDAIRDCRWFSNEAGNNYRDMVRGMKDCNFDFVKVRVEVVDE
jgi:hypothetical protein